MKYLFGFLLISIIYTSCRDTPRNTLASNETRSSVEMLDLNLEQAERLANLPLDCAKKEYPNKLNQVLGSPEDLKGPKSLHPSFYGCFDWHSSVHGHWSLVSLLKQYPKMKNAQEAKDILLSHITAQNIEGELAYFDDANNKNFERTYGWAWLLKLAEELYTWEDSIAIDLYKNLQPLTEMVVEKYIDFLPKLVYPIRVGEHPNTAFGLSFALDYAQVVGAKELEKLIIDRSNAFFINDKNCPILWEPSGYDFLSPCLEEANLMSKILDRKEFKSWLEAFMPSILLPTFIIDVGEVSDRSDGKLVHLDGVNFSRAWCLNGIAKNLDNSDHLKSLAQDHIKYSLPNLIGDDYEGGHWLGSFAIYALNSNVQ